MKKVLATRLVSKAPSLSRKQPNLLEYHQQRNRVLINREIGGLGDILMHRMMFEDLKKSGMEVHFACPKQYHPAVQDHPYIDLILDCSKVDPYDYQAAYNTTTACGRHEMRVAPFSDLHRSDIWSQHCGLDLTNHEMHIKFTKEEMEYGDSKLLTIKSLAKVDLSMPTVAVCPTSAMMGKNLTGTQVTGLLDGIKEFDVFPFGLHTKPVPEVESRKVPMVHGLGIRQWMAVMNAADYAITVDTSAFHLAGGLKKPVVGVFSFVDGLVYGKYFEKFVLVQKHRKNGDWYCGPCYNWTACPKSKLPCKPCITEIRSSDIIEGFEKLLKKQYIDHAV